MRSAIRQQMKKAGLDARRRRWPKLAAFTSGPVRGSGSGREMIRHFTHLAERADGLARGAGVPVDSLLELQHPAYSEADEAQAACVLDGGSGSNLVRTLAGGAWLVRRSRPEVGFASLELTEPWCVSSVAGINEAGLAVCMAPSGEIASPRESAASSQFFVQECLQRFEEIEAGIDWCLNRPAKGQGTLLLADAAGRLGAVHFGAAGPEPERSDGSPILAGLPGPAMQAFESWAASPATGRVPLSGSVMVRLDCGGRRLELKDGSSSERILALEIAPSEDPEPGDLGS
ncbi:MAG: hypothetical protein OSB70_15005 [Myxococcota bacterium]|nr:hypothetical protein [Myxococcota bacterium]